MFHQFLCGLCMEREQRFSHVEYRYSDGCIHKHRILTKGDSYPFVCVEGREAERLLEVIGGGMSLGVADKQDCL